MDPGTIGAEIKHNQADSFQLGKRQYPALRRYADKNFQDIQRFHRLSSGADPRKLH